MPEITQPLPAQQMATPNTNEATHAVNEHFADSICATEASRTHDHEPTWWRRRRGNLLWLVCHNTP